MAFPATLRQTQQRESIYKFLYECLIVGCLLVLEI